MILYSLKFAILLTLGFALGLQHFPMNLVIVIESNIMFDPSTGQYDEMA